MGSLAPDLKKLVGKAVATLLKESFVHLSIAHRASYVNTIRIGTELSAVPLDASKPFKNDTRCVIMLTDIVKMLS